MSDCAIILPHQLFDPHPAVSRDRPVVFIEDSLLFGDSKVGQNFHQQKIVLHRASMKTFAAELERRGHEVHYREHERDKPIDSHLESLRCEGYDTFHLCEPVDFLMEKRIGRFSDRSGCTVVREDTPMFLSPADFLAEHFDGKKKPRMAGFYQRQRERLGILLNKDGSPKGGKWSLDEDNRKPMPKSGLDVPADPSARRTRHSKEAIGHVTGAFPDYFGQADDFAYPVSHSSAERWFDRFLEERLRLFGDYEDAISRRERVLFHGVLTPMLNIGLLTPRKIVDRALQFAEEEGTPLNSLEGFIRQVIGWREFMRGAYEHLGVECRNGNFWDFEDRAIPGAFYDATTGIEPVDLVIRQVLDHGYCHHIERLMILGNFMLLCGFHPRRVYQWFMELFVDAYDWVMVPNVFGMSQFADGGLFTTKPYISGSNYVRKMSDHPKGDWCETWDGLFWSFIDEHDVFFRSQHRLGMMVRQLEKMDGEKRKTHLRNAADFLSAL